MKFFYIFIIITLVILGSFLFLMKKTENIKQVINKKNKENNSILKIKIQHNLSKYENKFLRISKNSNVYLIKNNEKRLIPDKFTLISLDGFEEKILTVSKKILNKFKTGKPIKTIIDPKVKNNFLSLFNNRFLKKEDHSKKKNIIRTYYRVNNNKIDKFNGKYILNAKNTFKYSDILIVSKDLLNLFKLNKIYDEDNIKNKNTLKQFYKLFDNYTVYNSDNKIKTHQNKIFKIKNGMMKKIDWTIFKGTDAKKPLKLPPMFSKIFKLDTTENTTQNNNNDFLIIYEKKYVKTPENENIYEIINGKKELIGKSSELDIKKDKLNIIDNNILKLFPNK